LKIGKTTHFAALEIKDMPEFLKTLERNDARLFSQTRRGIRLLMLTFVRTSELIEATWDEIDLENAIWEIPAARMKMGKPHIVPLSRQVVALFKEQREETAHINTPWVFPNQVRPKKPMSNNTILFGIKRLGYQGRMTGHGFRALAMTTLMERLGYPHEIPDAQLAHAKGDNVRRAYDRTVYLPQRTKMMQEWADYIDALASGGKVVTGNFRKQA
jgi:integrase